MEFPNGEEGLGWGPVRLNQASDQESPLGVFVSGVGVLGGFGEYSTIRRSSLCWTSRPRPRGLVVGSGLLFGNVASGMRACVV